MDPDRFRSWLVDYTVGRDCWRLESSTAALDRAHTDVVTGLRYDPGRTRTTRFDAYGHPDNTGPCLAAGGYGITNEYRLAPDVVTTEDETAFDWGFTPDITTR